MARSASLLALPSVSRKTRAVRPCFSGALALSIAGILGSCASDRVGGTASVRDSAGVHIVENLPDAWPPPEIWQVSDSAVVDIGVREGDPDYELFQVNGAAHLPDGGIVVAEFGARLKYFDAAGRHVRTLERRGEGPGEAGAFLGLQPYRGDSLLLTTDLTYSSRSLTRMLVLAVDGTYGRDIMGWYPGESERSERVQWGGGNGNPAAFSDGSIVIEGAKRFVLEGSAGDLLPGWTALLRLDPEAGVADTAAVVRNGALEYRPLDARKWERLLDEARPAPIRTRGMHLYRSPGDRFAVDIYEATPFSADTEPASIGPRPAPPRAAMRLASSYRIDIARTPTTDESREAYIAPLIEIVRGNGTDAQRAEYRARLEGLRSPDSVAAVQDLQVDALGNIWLELYQPPGAEPRQLARTRGISVETGPSTWVVLDEEGRLLGSVRMPIGFHVYEIGAADVLGLWHDELGVPHVRVHRLGR